MTVAVAVYEDEIKDLNVDKSVVGVDNLATEPSPGPQQHTTQSIV